MKSLLFAVISVLLFLNNLQVSSAINEKCHAISEETKETVSAPALETMTLSPAQLEAYNKCCCLRLAKSCGCDCRCLLEHWCNDDRWRFDRCTFEKCCVLICDDVTFCCCCGCCCVGCNPV